jgi:hypothetical protein
MRTNRNKAFEPDINEPFSDLDSVSSGSSRSARRNRSNRRTRVSGVPFTCVDYVDSYGVNTNSERDLYFDQFLRSTDPDLRVELLTYELRPADFKALYAHLKRYVKPKLCRPPNDVATVISLNLLDSVCPKLVQPLSILQVKVNWTAGPGHFYREEGFLTKSCANRAILEDCLDALLLFEEGTLVSPRYYRAGGRSRLAKSDVEVAKSGRMIQSQDGRDVRLCQMVSQAWTNSLSNTGWIAFGTSHFHGYARRTVRDYIGCVEVWAFDISGMDTSLDLRTNVKWIVAFLLRRSHITPAHAQFIWDSIALRDLVMPDGAVYEMDSGLASGHAFTSLVETVLMLFLVTATFSELLLEFGFSPWYIETLIEEQTIELLGDDGRIGVTRVMRSFVSWDTFARKFEELFAGRLRPAKCEVRTYNPYFDMCETLPAFLGKCYTLEPDGSVSVFRRDEEVLAMKMWPERSAMEPWQSYVKTCGLIIDNPDGDLTQHILRAYAEWLIETYALVDDFEWDSEVKRSVFMTWSCVNNKELFGAYARVFSRDDLDELYN